LIAVIDHSGNGYGQWVCVGFDPANPDMGIQKNHFSTSQSSSGTTGDMMFPMIRVPLSLGDGLRRTSATLSSLDITSSSNGMTMTSTLLALKDVGNRSVRMLFSNECDQLS